VRAILGGILFGLTAAYPTLAALLWHATSWAASPAVAAAAWSLHQPAAVVALAVAVGWRYVVRRMRGRTA